MVRKSISLEIGRWGIACLLYASLFITLVFYEKSSRGWLMSCLFLGDIFFFIQVPSCIIR